eukprot:UN04102
MTFEEVVEEKETKNTGDGELEEGEYYIEDVYENPDLAGDNTMGDEFDNSYDQQLDQDEEGGDNDD